MIIQDLWTFDRRKRLPVKSDSGAIWRRFFIFGGTLALTAFLVHAFYQMVSVFGMTGLQYVLLVLFAVNVAWISLAFMIGLAGLLSHYLRLSNTMVQIRDLKKIEKIKGRVAILIPTYNETPDRIFGSALAVNDSLNALGFSSSFDIFVLSDTTNSDIWVQEEAAFAIAREKFEHGQRHLHYRRRLKNTGKKAGNVAEWCDTWGPEYDYMIVFDADSLMTGDCLIKLADAMDRHSDMGLIQTSPQCINRNTLFARMQQFAGQAYGALMASGLSFWHRGEGNFWGHNAIIRTKAFCECAGLPVLRGKPPFGGPIMSHDFVEAALMRRAGWRVCMVPELKGSYEESPPSLLDFAQRDRRWCQGNLQHIRVLPTVGLHWVSRMHFIMGIMSYLSTLFWAAFLSVGVMISIQAHFGSRDYFGEELTLFPTWPRQDSEHAVILLAMTLTFLLLPKFFGYMTLMTNSIKRKAFGGGFKLTLSVLLETILSSLMAPVMMLIQSKAIIDIVRGKDSGWRPQSRDDGTMPVSQIMQAHMAHTLMGLLIAFICYLISFNLLLWMSPLVLGLLLAAPLSYMTAHYKAGLVTRNLGLFVIPEEFHEPAIALAARQYSEMIDSKIHRGEALTQLAANPSLRILHRRLLPADNQSSISNINVDLALARAKLEASDNLSDLIASLTPSEKTALLSDARSVAQLMHLFEATTAIRDGKTLAYSA